MSLCSCQRFYLEKVDRNYDNRFQRPRSLSLFNPGKYRTNCVQRSTITCGIAKTKTSASSPSPAHVALVEREPHKFFDHATINVRSGDGGNGTIFFMPSSGPSKSRGENPEKEKSKKKNQSYKRDFDGSLILPIGGCGGDVIIYADEGKDTLLELHTQGRFNGKRGGNVDSAGTLMSNMRNGINAPSLRIPVPVGTVVKRRKGGLLADLAQPGDEVIIARGGQGGVTLLDGPERTKKRLAAQTTNVMRNDSDKVLIHGQPGEEVALELILRIVADVGLVGLPNAGKSTLLAAITRAKPNIADYPFTTLMPNLGRLPGENLGFDATLADLPGLIEGAHLGKGLGRNFLRHLRRTRILVHVVDASAEDPVNDYRTVKEELRMYNPQYLERCHIVVLNKVDLLEGGDRLPQLVEQISAIGNSAAPSNHSAIEKQLEDYPPPLAVLAVSVLTGFKINDMIEAIQSALRTSTPI